MVEFGQRGGQPAPVRADQAAFRQTLLAFCCDRGSQRGAKQNRGEWGDRNLPTRSRQRAILSRGLGVLAECGTIAALLLTPGFSPPSLAQNCTLGTDCAGQVYRGYLDSYAKSVAAARKAGDKAKETEAIVNAARAHQYFGRFQKALEIYPEALTLARSSQNQGAEAEVLGLMAIAHFKLKDGGGIEFLEQQLLQTRDRPSQAVILQELGNHAATLENHQKAIAAYTRRIALVTNPLAKAATLWNLSNSYSKLGEPLKAVELLKQALALMSDQPGANRFLYLRRMGELYLKKEASDSAIEVYNQLIGSALRQNNWFWAVEGLQGMATSYAVAGNLPKTQELLQSAITVAETMDNPNLAATLQRETLDRLSLVSAWKGDYATAIRIQQKLGKGFRAGDRAFINTDLDDIYYEHLGAFYLRSGQYKEAEVALRKAIAHYTESRKSDDPNYDNLIANADQTAVGNYEMAAETYRHLQEALVAQNRSEEALEVAEESRSRAFVGLLSTRLGVNPKLQPVFTPPKIAQIKQLAKAENSTLVVYSTLYSDITAYTETGKFRLGSGQPKESGLLIWVVKPTGEVVARSVNLTQQLPGQTLTELVRQGREAIGTRGRGVPGKPTTQTGQSQTRLQQLYQLLIQPIADQLPTNPSERVTFLPQDALYLVPFAALETPDRQYLIEKHTLLMAPSLQVLELSPRSGTSSTLTPALVVGNPTMPSLRVALDDTPEPLPDLPGAEQEAKTIAQLLNTQPLLGSQATQEAVVARLPQAKLIHLATHGILENLQGLQSAIALAPGGRSDGFLTANQVLQLKLTANLVVLSACDTGRGEITGDGVIGLSRSFISAGVPSVVVSLWAVPDAPTASLMSEFYQALKLNPDKATALRQAMLKTRTQYPDPRDWAAFTLIGQP